MKDIHKSIIFFGPVPPPTHGESFAFYQAFLNYPGPKHLVNKNTSGGSLLKKFWITILNILSLIWICSTRSFDLYYFSCTRTFIGSTRDLLFIVLAKFNKKPVVVHLHGADFSKFVENLPNWYRVFYIRYFKTIKCAIVLLEEMKKELFVLDNAVKIVVVENFYDPSFDTYEVDLSQPNRPIRLIYFSNIMYSKGIFVLLNSYVQLKREFNNIELHIAGKIMGDSYMSRIEVKKKFEFLLRENPEIKYYNGVYGKEKFIFLCKGDVFILPSFFRSEAFPISILEAMRTSNIIITTEHNYLPYIISDKMGIVVQPNDINSLVDGLVKIIDQPKWIHKIQLSNQNYAKKNFGLKNHLDKLYACFEENIVNNI